jgi:DNA invertase Pin-like site-specific DNA recombinase
MARGIDYTALAKLPPGVPRGEAHCAAVLTDELVREIRRLHREGAGYGRIARAVGISRSQVHRVVKRVAWAHVE